MMNALTLRGSGILRVIVSDVGVSLPFLGGTPGEIASFKGIWDTGASSSVITTNVVKALNLVATGKTMISHAQGSSITNTYLVNIHLPSNVTVGNVVVTEGKLPNGVDLLVGMDIITLGDFSITNKDQITVMSFRMPSSVCHDYVPESNNRNQLENRIQHGAQKGFRKKRKKVRHHR